MFVCVKLPEVELLDKVCKAVCSNFARVGGELGVFCVCVCLQVPEISCEWYFFLFS